ncbi:SDR family oxidoreductase [Cryobacterium glaciale]|uniref:SDR family oxidoreductase n=1 Tax=Cryobacterium glaciale TaxID=1259145 RepID=A0A4R8V521_9MICO|nr:SDR family NAD(P)-dependent oxidoreductase [Cryobacterium glaciale]TFB77302.1 SDR family oxidoreductase [Cryobacterium glaciale]
MQNLVVVTGGGSGMGRAIALGMAAQGKPVAVLDRDLEGAEETVREIRERGGEATSFYVDISLADEVSAACAAVEETYGPAHTLINNAGWEEIMPFMETSPEFRLKNISINLLGTMSVSSTFLRGMIDAGRGGRVVNISSDAGRVGSSGEAVYSGAKGGIIAFTKSIAREMVRYQITSNCVCPGPTETRMLSGAPKKLTDSLEKAIPMRRLAQPEDIMNAVRFFASEESSYITGQTLSVSGGLTMAG